MSSLISIKYTQKGTVTYFFTLLKLSIALVSLDGLSSFNGFKPRRDRIRFVSSTEQDISPSTSETTTLRLLGSISRLAMMIMVIDC